MTENELKERLKRLAESCPTNAGPGVERRLVAAFRERQRQRRRLRDYAAEIAASLLVVGGLYFLLEGAASHPRTAAASDPFRDAGFVLLPYGQSDVPLEHPVIVHVQIPASELDGIGGFHAVRAQGKVRADLLVGQDGVARAVRVVE